MSFPILDEHRLAATDTATLRLLTGRTKAWAALDDVEALRERGGEMDDAARSRARGPRLEVHEAARVGCDENVGAATVR